MPRHYRQGLRYEHHSLGVGPLRQSASDATQKSMPHLPQTEGLAGYSFIGPLMDACGDGMEHSCKAGKLLDNQLVEKALLNPSDVEHQAIAINWMTNTHSTIRH